MHVGEMRVRTVLRELKVVVVADAQTEVWLWWEVGPYHTLYAMPKESWKVLMMSKGRGMVIFLLMKANSEATMKKN